MKRQSGHYWVKLRSGSWWVAYYSATRLYWLVPGDTAQLHDDSFSYISENRVEEPEIAR